MIYVTLSSSCKHRLFPRIHQQQLQQCRSVHAKQKYIRIICKDDLPNGKGKAGDVLQVRSGYALNYLLPREIAVFAKPKNFEYMGIKDPAKEARAAKWQRAADKVTEKLKDQRVRNSVDMFGGCVVMCVPCPLDSSLKLHVVDTRSF
jgi:hypothetical protein